MKFTLSKLHASKTAAQRNALAALLLLSMAVNILQGALNLVRSERIIVNPPDCSASYSVKAGRYSASYLIEMARYYSHVLLETSPSRLDSSADIILRNATSDNYHALQVLLIETSKKLAKDNITTSFEVKESLVSPETLTVRLTGTFCTYTEGKRLESGQKTFSMTFKNSHGSLLIAAFREIRDDDNESC